MNPSEFFGPLFGVDHVPAGDEDLLFYWSIPASRDIANFVWDTGVPEVTNPWPRMEPASIRDAMVMVLGREDVTGHLYSLADLEAHAKQVEAKCDEPPCRNCGQFCGDKWCGLRGDTQVIEVIDGEVADAGTP